MNTKKKKLGSMVTIGFSISVLIYVLVIGVSNTFRYNKFKTEYHTAAQSYELTREINARYRNSLNTINDPQYWEIQARTKLGYIRAGEEVYRIVGRESTK